MSITWANPIGSLGVSASFFGLFLPSGFKSYLPTPTPTPATGNF